MAEGERGRVGGIGRAGRTVEPKAHLHHLLHLGLVGPTPSGNGVFHLARRVVGHVATTLRCGRQNHTACLGDADGRTDIGLEKDALDRHGSGPEFVENRIDVVEQGRQPAGHVVAGACADDTQGHGFDQRVRHRGKHGVATSRETGVDTKHPHGTRGTGRLRGEHTFYAT